MGGQNGLKQNVGTQHVPSKMSASRMSASRMSASRMSASRMNVGCGRSMLRPYSGRRTILLPHIGGGSEMKINLRFILHFSRLALSLQRRKESKSQNI